MDSQQDVSLRWAEKSDLEGLVQLLGDDPLGRTREVVTLPLDHRYQLAFEAIAEDPNNGLLVAIGQGGDLVGVLQLTFIPSLTYIGSWRGQIEGVRVAPSWRGRGLGRQLFEKAITLAKKRGCRLLQLTTDKKRPRALKFYESLGMTASHEGMKLVL